MHVDRTDGGRRPPSPEELWAGIVAEVATMRSPSCNSLLYPPHVPTLSKFLAPSCINSSATIEALGHPIPVVWTETGSPL